MIGPPEEIAAQVVVAPPYRSAPGNWVATVAPTVNDDESLGYNYSSHWYKVTFPYGLWVCTDPTATTAIWREVPLSTIGVYVLATASEAMSPGQMANLWLDASILKVRKANATDNTKPCDGYIFTISPSVGQVVPVRTGHGSIIESLSGLTIGNRLYLSTTGGGVTATAPTGTGKIVQPIGKALSATSALFSPEPYVVLP